MIIDHILNLTPETLNKLDLSFIQNYNMYHDTSYFYGYAGKEHYRLLMYISTLYENKIIFDIGTNKCMSAMALSYNKNNIIKTYDVIKILIENPVVSNIKYNLGNSIDDEDIKKCPFIFLDVDHDGLYEKIIYDYLISINWKGILLLDDIHLNESMKTYWNSFSQKKYDLTNIGHWSGTGLVLFE